MKIKNMDELRYVVSTALCQYANHVERGFDTPFTKFLESEDPITVTVTLVDGHTITVKPFIQEVAQPEPQPEPEPTVEPEVTVEPEEAAEQPEEETLEQPIEEKQTEKISKTKKTS